MKILTVMLLGLCLICSPAFAQTEQQQVKTAIEQVAQAIKNKDKTLYEQYVSPQYIHTNPGGEVTNREQEYSDMTSGVQTFSSIETIELPYDQIRIFN